METGDLISPDGTPYRGFKVTIGGIGQTPTQTYDDIERIMKSNQAAYKTHETDDAAGHFRTYTVET